MYQHYVGKTLLGFWPHGIVTASHRPSAKSWMTIHPSCLSRCRWRRSSLGLRCDSVAEQNNTANIQGGQKKSTAANLSIKSRWNPSTNL